MREINILPYQGTADKPFGLLGFMEPGETALIFMFTWIVISNYGNAWTNQDHLPHLPPILPLESVRKTQSRATTILRSVAQTHELATPQALATWQPLQLA